MIHSPIWFNKTKEGKKNLMIYTLSNQIQKTKEESAKILADRCGKNYEDVLKDFDRDYWMNADEALKYGIVDKQFKGFK